MKPEHRQHRKVGRLTDREYRLWVGMILEADDEGRLVADPGQLRLAIFGYWPKVSDREVTEGIATLASAGLVVLYAVDGVPYAAFPSWRDHQRINRPQASSLPAPTDSSPTEIPFSEHSLNVHSGSEGKGKERNGREGKGHRALARAYPPGFERWWTAYPNKIGKDKAAESWRKRNLEPLAEEIIAGLERTRNHVTRDGGKWVPLPATWLNQGRWKDEPAEPLPFAGHDMSGLQRFAERGE